MKVLFMGTPDFAVPTLKALIESEHEVIGVVTQPDKPKGRGKAVLYTPVKECAVEHNIEVYQPVKVKDDEFLDFLENLDFDVIVVVAFGQILPKRLLDMPKEGCINVHSSLLPAYRGAAPIQWTIIMGETRTGVTTMYMDEGLDTGDILLQETTDITEEDTGGTLHDRLADMGAKLLIRTLADIKAGSIIRIKQDDAKSNYVGMLNKNHGDIDFNKSAVEIERLVRGLNPWPSAFTKLDGKTLKIWKAKVINECIFKENLDNNKYIEGIDDISKAVNGEIVAISKDSIIVKTGKEYLQLLEVQLEGKKRMAVDAFLRGYEVHVNTVLK